MREIEFRGMHSHMFSCWVYGYLVDENYINDKRDMGDGEYLGEMLIDPKTVGQFTGLLDKNGTKIFEGDIVREMDTTYCRLVAFGKLGYDSNWNGLTGFGFKDNERDYYGEGNKFMEIRFHDDPERLIVIGNIHDNPELLESEVEE
jgi:uncharacterized phage protein (TIGR01671 family)